MQPKSVASIAGAVSNGIYIPSQSALLLKVRNSVTGLSLRVKLTMIAYDGDSAEILDTIPLSLTSRSEEVKVYPLTEGYVLACDISVVGTTVVHRGQTFVTVQVMYGQTYTPLKPVYLTLAADYVTPEKPVSFPTTGVQSSVNGRGHMRLVTHAAPAAGSDAVSWTVPDHVLWRIRGISMTLTCGGAGTRNLIWSFTEGTNLYYVTMTAAITTGAATSAELSWRHDTGTNFSLVVGTTTFYHIVLPEIWLRAGDIIDFATSAGLNALDTLGNISLWVEEWIDAGAGAGGSGGAGGIS